MLALDPDGVRRLFSVYMRFGQDIEDDYSRIYGYSMAMPKCAAACHAGGVCYAAKDDVVYNMSSGHASGRLATAFQIDGF